MWKPKLNPVTRKRLRRFAAYRRSYWSFWILVTLYVISLFANLISNDRPLYVKYEGKSYFPLLKYYPDTVFTDSGLNTRPNYKRIAKSDRFAEKTGNYMVFTLNPYGPYETLSAEDVDISDRVTVVAERVQRAASINIDENLRVERANAVAGLLEGDDGGGVEGMQLRQIVPLSDAGEEAIRRRFANEQNLERYTERVETPNGTELTVSMSRFTARSRKPNDVRLTLREEIAPGSGARFGFSEGERKGGDRFWESLSEADQERIRKAAEERVAGPVSPLALQADGISYRVQLEKQDVRFPFPPNANNIFGLDSSGRDVFARVLYALRISLNFGLLLVLITMFVGVAVGGYQGYRGGAVDLVGQRFTEIWGSLPFLYIMIMMGSLFGRSLVLLLLIYGIFNWIAISYYVRGEFLKLRKQPFVEAAHCLGLSSFKIMSRHILPNALVPVITFFPFSLVGAIFALSALDFLGFGLPPPTPSWGELLAQAQEYKDAWWLVLYPSLALFVVILLGVFIGEGIRAAFDPRVNSRYES